MTRYFIPTIVIVAWAVLHAEASAQGDQPMSVPSVAADTPAIQRMHMNPRPRPTFPFARDTETILRRQVRDLKRGLQKGGATVDSAYLKNVRDAVGLWQISGKAADRKLVDDAIAAGLAPHEGKTPAELARGISEKGAQDPANKELRNACYLFALRYHLTGERADAERAATLLARFAVMLPRWPVFDGRWKTYPQMGPDTYGEWDLKGVWGVWIYMDVGEGYWLAEAYELILATELLDEMNARERVEAMLRRHVEISFQFGKAMFNMDPTQMRGILQFAYILGEPEWVHSCADWIVDFYKVGFYYDGWWHEGSVSYHKQTHHGFRNCARIMQGYSDPKGYTPSEGERIENLDIEGALKRDFARADAVMDAAVQPDRTAMVIHDTRWPQSTWWRAPLEEAKPVLWGGMGHAVLAFGKEPGRMVQASLHFSGTHNHEHYDMMHLTLFARGKELMSETRYRPLDAKNSTHEWHRRTAAHITVAIDGKDHRHRYAPPSTPGEQPTVRRKQPEDAVPGVPDWKWRWRRHGDTMHDGRLQMYHAEFDDVQVVEATGERSLIPVAREFRRMIALVRIGDGECYVVDVFRVSGGRLHEYFLHGCLPEPHDLTTSVSPSKPVNAKLHKYIENLEAGRTDGDWTATFALDKGDAAVTHYLVGERGTEFARGTAPAMRRLGTAPFLVVRRGGGESVFVAVHHPHGKTPLIRKVERVALAPDDGRAVALRIHLPGRTDTVMVSTDDAPFETERRTVDGALAMRGRFAHVAQKNDGAPQWLYLVGGDRLRAAGREISETLHHEGVLTRSYRIDGGDTFDGFETGAELPSGEALKGEHLIVDIGGLLTWAFRIASVERRDGKTVIRTDDVPGMTIAPGLVKLEHFPCWGVKGEARFRILRSALLR